jgi:hypothetical protein
MYGNRVANSLGPLSQRDLYNRLRAVLDTLADPTLAALTPVEYARAELALEAAFGACPEEAIFGPHVLYNLGKKKVSLLRARYAEWTARRESAKEPA